MKEHFSVFNEMRKYIREEGVMDIEATSPTDLKKIQYEELLFKIIRTVRRCILFNDVNGLINEVKLLEVTVDPYISEVRRDIIKDIDNRMNQELNSIQTIASNRVKQTQTNMTIFRYSFNKLEMILLAMQEERIFFLSELYLIMVMLHYSDIIKSAVSDKIIFMNEVLMLKAVIFPFIKQDQVKIIDVDLEITTNNYRYLSENGQSGQADMLLSNFSYRLLRYLVDIMNHEGFLYEQSQSVNLGLAVLPYEENKPISPEEKKASYVLTSIYARLHYKNQNWLGCIVGQTGCLDADTKIKVWEQEKIKYKKLKDLDKFEEVISYNFKKKGFEINIAEVTKSGKKPCYKITFSDGTSVTATEDHRFFKTNGKPITVKQIIKEYKKKGSRDKDKRFHLCSRNYPLSNENPFYGKEHTKEFKEKQHKKFFKTGIRAYNRKLMLNKLPNYCEDCKSTKRKLCVHHKDNNRYNNNINNLRRLCFQCHAKYHNWGRKKNAKNK